MDILLLLWPRLPRQFQWLAAQPGPRSMGSGLAQTCPEPSKVESEYRSERLDEVVPNTGNRGNRVSLVLVRHLEAVPRIEDYQTRSSARGVASFNRNVIGQLTAG